MSSQVKSSEVKEHLREVVKSLVVFVGVLDRLPSQVLVMTHKLLG